MLRSTGRSARVKHSTGSDEKKTEKARRAHPRPRTSTGEHSTIIHFTGGLFDLKREEELEIEGQEQAPRARKRAARHKPPQAA